MKHYLFLVLVLCLLVGCGAEPTPTADAGATQIAAEKAAYATMTAEAPTATDTPAPTETSTPTHTPSLTPTPTHTDTPTATPTPTPTLTPTPTPAPTDTPTPTPTDTPTSAPTRLPTATPVPSVLRLVAPTELISLWNSWNGKYVLYAQRETGIQQFSDLASLELLIAPLNVSLSELMDDVNAFNDAGGIQMDLVLVVNLGAYKSTLLERPGLVGLMVPEVAAACGFEENESLIPIQLVPAP